MGLQSKIHLDSQQYKNDFRYLYPNVILSQNYNFWRTCLTAILAELAASATQALFKVLHFDFTSGHNKAIEDDTETISHPIRKPVRTIQDCTFHMHQRWP